MSAFILLFCLTLWGYGVQEPRELIDRLGADRVEDRDEAARLLRQLGRPALPELEKAARGSDLEIASRARLLIQSIVIGEGLTPRLKKSLPGVEVRLAGDDREWTKVLQEAVASDDLKLFHPELTRQDLEPLLVRAARGSRTPQEMSVISETAEHWRIRSAAPAIVRLMGTPGWPERGKGLSALRRIGSSADVPGLIRLLASPEHDVRRMALPGISMLGGPEQLPILRRSLEDPNEAVQEMAAGLIVQYAPADTVTTLLKRLKEENFFIRVEALRALASTRSPEALLALKEGLKDVQPEVRIEAVSGLGFLGDPGDLLLLVKLLSDSDEKVRGEAAAALGRRKVRESGDAIARLLEDPSPGVQTVAISALIDLDRKDVGPRILPLLKSGTENVRAQAARACGVFGLHAAVPDLLALLDGEGSYDVGQSLAALLRMKRKEAAPHLSRNLESNAWWHRSILLETVHTIGFPELRETALKRLADSNGYARMLAADWLCRMGSREGVVVLLDQGYSLTSINRLRKPEIVLKLEACIAPLRITGNFRAAFDQAAREAGLTVEWSELALGDPARRSTVPVEASTWMLWTSALDIMETLTFESLGAICEVDRIRIVTRDEAEVFWRAWLIAQEQGK